MTNDLNYLSTFITKNKIELSFLTFISPVTNSILSAKEVKDDISKIIKTIVFHDERDIIYAVILRANKNVDSKVLKKLFSVKDIRLIERNEIVKKIGYPAGGVPPFGFKAVFIIDSDLNSSEILYAGGGDCFSLIKIKISEILRVTKGKHIKISK